MADWSKLPYDIIHMVAKYLEAIEDFVAFSAVCHSWRSVYLARQWFPGRQVPWLMLSDIENSERIFVSLSRNKVHSFELPEAHCKQCFGSSSIWLLTIGNDFKMHLLNAFTRVRLDLPTKSSLQVHFDNIQPWYHCIDKVLVVNKPFTSFENEDDLLVVIIYGPLNQLAFSRPGFSSWITVNATSPGGGFRDIAYVNNHIDGPHPPKIIWVAMSPWWSLSPPFLVESCGDLLLVYQCKIHNDRKSSMKSVSFVIYSFDFSKRQWIRIHNLKNRVIFVGDNCCTSICTSELVYCKHDSIYFVADRDKRWRTDSAHCVDLFVYNMDNGIVEPLSFDIPKHYSCSLWVMPTLF
ncbi:F-box protein At2g17036-like [Henckelia pumila]|uniref:F-box protein At2g17036-like n=1 Tax=Henckelia pumila TaxID=405737 RepID=UPI003C6DFBAB